LLSLKGQHNYLTDLIHQPQTRHPGTKKKSGGAQAVKFGQGFLSFTKEIGL
jgi:hypothetical protein